MASPRRAVWRSVFCKEWRELLRDRRSLVFTLLVPILALPAAILIFGGFGPGPEGQHPAPAAASNGMVILLPIFLTLVCFVGCMYPAIDVVAGERERRTLETLWLTPAARSKLIGGKILLCASTGWASAVVCLAVYCVGGWLIPSFDGLNSAGAQSWSSSAGNVAVPAAVFICIWLLPLALTVAPALVAISVSARTFKEAQSMMMPLYIGLTLAMAPLFMGRDLASAEGAWRWATVPVLNLTLLIQQQVRQQIAWSFACVALSICLCSRASRREHFFQQV